MEIPVGQGEPSNPRKPRSADLLVGVVVAFASSVLLVAVLLQGLSVSGLGPRIQDLVVAAASISLAIGQPDILRYVVRKWAGSGADHPWMAVGAWSSSGALLLIAAVVAGNRGHEGI